MNFQVANSNTIFFVHFSKVKSSSSSKLGKRCLEFSVGQRWILFGWLFIRIVQSGAAPPPPTHSSGYKNSIIISFVFGPDLGLFNLEATKIQFFFKSWMIVRAWLRRKKESWDSVVLSSSVRIIGTLYKKSKENLSVMNSAI
jgi:hypothetical protein